ncbi:MAG: hypothetical protein NVS4B11_36900 [Ktedonobacteraceae bacterium]
MHGLIFVTWEQYLTERFGLDLLRKYRAAIGETAANAPLASRVYDDATLLAGVSAACQLTHLPADTLLHEYGRYFMCSGLTSHLCTYLLQQVHSGRDLLLIMRDAHAQMRRTPDGLTPPLFRYETSTQNDLVLLYDSPRHLCSVLLGAIEGAAERFGERVQVRERTCMKHGDTLCRFELRFFALSDSPEPHLTPQVQEHRQKQQYLTTQVWNALPQERGITLADLQQLVKQRPSLLLESLRHLQYAGLVSTSVTEPGDNLTNRRYWRAPTSD